MKRAFAYAGLLAGFIAIGYVAAWGQSMYGGGPKFEIADIHPSSAASGPNGQFMRGGLYRGGRYEVRTATMVDLIRTAYAVDADTVTGGPGWMETDRFDIIAKAPADSKPETMQLMLRDLLADRFKLVVHNDTKPLPAYVLTPGKKVLLKPADPSGETGCKIQPQPDPPPGTPTVGMVSMNGVVLRLSGANSLIVYSCRNITMAAFAAQMRQMVFLNLNGNRVVDQTELKGAWDFDVKYTFNLRIGPLNQEAAGDVVTIFNAVDKQLGLKLELGKVPTPVIQVDSVNEKPTDNLPGVTAKLPVLPTEFEVADIKPSAPIEDGPGGGRGGGCAFCPGGRVNLRNETVSQMISLAWSVNGPANSGRIVGLPKSADTTRWDIVAKASTMTSIYPPTNGQAPVEQVDIDSMRIMLQALLKDRFKLAIHEEQRPLPGYALVAVKPKLKPADPSNRPSCKEGPGPDGKDPRTTNPAASRLVTCLNTTMAEFAKQIPLTANGYFVQFPGGMVDATKLDGAYDITINFSVAGAVGAGGGGGRGGNGEGGAGPGGAPEASEPSSAISLQEAMEKQLGLKMEPQKNPGTVYVIDHVEEKPTDN